MQLKYLLLRLEGFEQLKTRDFKMKMIFFTKFAFLIYINLLHCILNCHTNIKKIYPKATFASELNN